MKNKLLLTLSTIFIGIIIGFLIHPVISSDNIYNQIKKFEFVLNTAYRNYVEDVDVNKLTESAIKGMLNELDVHSVYLTAEQMKKVDEDFEGSFEGVGIEFDIINDTIVVVAPIPGGPSEEMGIQSNDKIVTIDGKDVVGIDRSEVPKMLKGKKGTKVELGIIRANEPELLRFTIIRDKIPNASVQTYYKIDGTDIGFIKVERFASTTYDEIYNASKSLLSEGIKKIILDLRGNPGGLYDQAVEMAQLFLKQGDTIVFTKGRRPTDVSYSLASINGILKDIPLIVLIDQGSASASEILAGAIQDLDRGLIVGETSYGKGLVQRQYKPGDGSAFRITIAKYYTPSGRCIQRPYKDKEKYRNLVGRIEPEEGANLEQSIEKIIKNFNKETEEIEIKNNKLIIKHINNNSDKSSKKNYYAIDTFDIHRTKSGRMVLSSGGIIPDFIIKPDTITILSRNIRNKNAFFEFSAHYMNRYGKEIKKKFSDDFNSFLKNFTIDDQIISEFKNFIISKEINWNEENYKKDSEYIHTMIKANIARSIWNRSKYLEIFYTQDKVVKKSIELFPEAEKLANLK